MTMAIFRTVIMNMNMTMIMNLTMTMRRILMLINWRKIMMNVIYNDNGHAHFFCHGHENAHCLLL